MMEYKTESGSTYQVRTAVNDDGVEMTEVRQVVRSSISVAKRVSEDWRPVMSLEAHGIGHPLVMWWGLGRDEHSASADTEQVGSPTEGDTVARCTQTTRVVAIDIIN